MKQEPKDQDLMCDLFHYYLANVNGLHNESRALRSNVWPIS